MPGVNSHLVVYFRRHNAMEGGLNLRRTACGKRLEQLRATYQAIGRLEKIAHRPEEPAFLLTRMAKEGRDQRGLHMPASDLGVSK